MHPDVLCLLRALKDGIKYWRKDACTVSLCSELLRAWELLVFTFKLSGVRQHCAALYPRGRSHREALKLLVGCDVASVRFNVPVKH